MVRFVVLIQFSDDFHFYMIQGTQHVSKFKEQNDARNTILVTLGVLRIPKVETDIVFSLSSPMAISNKSSSYSSATSIQSKDVATRVFAESLNSFNLVDWKLFA